MRDLSILQPLTPDLEPGSVTGAPEKPLRPKEEMVNCWGDQAGRFGVPQTPTVLTLALGS